MSVRFQTPPPTKKGVARQPWHRNRFGFNFGLGVSLAVLRGSFGGRAPGRAWPSGFAQRLASWGSPVRFRASPFALSGALRSSTDEHVGYGLSGPRPRLSALTLLRWRGRASFQGRLAASVVEGRSSYRIVQFCVRLSPVVLCCAQWQVMVRIFLRV